MMRAAFDEDAAFVFCAVDHAEAWLWRSLNLLE